MSEPDWCCYCDTLMDAPCDDEACPVEVWEDEEVPGEVEPVES